MVHDLPQIVLTARPNGRFDYASRRWFERTGHSPLTIAIDGAVYAGIDPRDATSFREAWERGISRGDSFSFETRLTTQEGARWHALRAAPTRRQETIIKWNVTLTDIESDVARRIALEHSRALLRALAEASRVTLDLTLEPRAIAQRIADLAAGALGGSVVVDVEDAHGTAQRAVAGLTVSHDDAIRDLEAFEAAPDAGSLRLSPRGTIAARTETPGASRVRIAALPAAHDPAYGDDDRDFIGELALRTGAALASAASYRREQRISAVLQRSMLPTALPRPASVTIDAAYRVAGDDALVGGDWYDAFEMPGGELALAIGDVAGHGLDAAIVMGHVRESVRVSAFAGDAASDVLAAANRTVLARPDVLVTSVFGMLDPLTLELTYANAAHPPPLIVDRDGTTHRLEYGGVALGLRERSTYALERASLENARALALFTDGLTEIGRDPIAGEERVRGVLGDWMRGGCLESAADLVETIVGGRSTRDDVALLLITFAPSTQLAFAIEPATREARRARHAATRFLAQFDIDEERRFGFVIALAEAINNAVEHGSRSSDERVAIEIDVVGEVASVIVKSRGPWRPHEPRLERGRGLTLMRALCTSLSVESDSDGTRVCLKLDDVRRKPGKGLHAS